MSHIICQLRFLFLISRSFDAKYKDVKQKNRKNSQFWNYLKNSNYEVCSIPNFLNPYFFLPQNIIIYSDPSDMVLYNKLRGIFDLKWVHVESEQGSRRSINVVIKLFKILNSYIYNSITTPVLSCTNFKKIQNMWNLYYTFE